MIENFFKPLTIPQFLEKIKDKFYGNTDFYVFIENEIELLKKARASGTIENYYKLLNTMKEWKPTLSFSEITLDFIQKFHNHELEVGNLLSTIYKKHSNFKFLVGIAVDKEKIAKSPYEKFEIKKNIKAQNNDVLTEEELEKLQAVYEKKVYRRGKQEVLREFLFSCYTGLAYNAIKQLTHHQLRIVSDQSLWLFTDKQQYPLSALPEDMQHELLKRDKSVPLFKLPTIQHININLRTIAIESGVCTDFTFKSAVL